MLNETGRKRKYKLNVAKCSRGCYGVAKEIVGESKSSMLDVKLTWWGANEVKGIILLEKKTDGELVEI